MVRLKTSSRASLAPRIQPEVDEPIAASPESPKPAESGASISLNAALKTAFSPWALGLLGAAVILAIILGRRFNVLLEDSFIFLRYSRNLFHGYGPVYNPGEEPVEGYTNFLWMLLWSASYFFTNHPENYLVLANQIFGGLLITAVWWELIRRGGVGRRWLWLGVFLLATHQTIHSWMSGGLETHFYVFLSVWAVGRFLREEFSPTENSWPLSAILMPLVLLTRPDGYISGVICGAVMVCRRIFRSRTSPGGWRRVGVYGGSCALIGGAHCLWRRLYYHDWLPNTFRAKVAGAWWESGFKYVKLFYHLNSLLSQR